MPDTPLPILPVAELRVGLYVHLGLNWMEHPFPFGSFKIGTQQQIDRIRALGLTQLRWDPDKSDDPAHPAPAASAPPPEHADASHSVEPHTPERQRREPAALAAQRQALRQCERHYAEGARAYKAILEQLQAQPQQAQAHSAQLVDHMVQHLLGDEESAIRLLSDTQGERNCLHAMNVTVLSLLLGKTMGLPAASLHALGQAALLHDVGKTALPDRVRHRDDSFTAAHHKLYQEHVAHSVAQGRRMGWSPLVLLTVSQHHELADGSGFPSGSKADQLAPTSRILALINRYDGLCNPPNPLKAQTPHEALSGLFVTQKDHFEASTLNAFIRMMGVYPPGSLVQLTDGRHALVAAVNAARPLKPRVLVHDAGVPSHDALLLDLQQQPDLGIQRSLRADQLPHAALAYLAPRQRVCYYFERAISPTDSTEVAA